MKKFIIITFLAFWAGMFDTHATIGPVPAPVKEEFSTLAEPPDQIPGSLEELTVWAFEHARHWTVDAWMAGTVTTKNTSSTSGEVEDGFSAIVQMNSARPQIDVLNPNEMLGLGGWIHDSKWNQLFWGLVHTNLAPVTNGISINQHEVTLRLADRIPIPFPNASHFYVVERDSDGNPVNWYSSQDWEVQDDSILYPTYFSTPQVKGGELVVTDKAGFQTAYYIKGGKKITPTLVKASAKFSILGMRLFADTEYVAVEISEKEYQEGRNPVVFLSLKEPQMVRFTGWISQPDKKALSRAIRVWKKGSDPSSGGVYHMPNSPDGLFSIPVRFKEAGEYWIQFLFDGWPVKTEGYQPPVNYDSGGGKGY